jgi:hypothetical protein
VTAAASADLADWAVALRDPAVSLADAVAVGRRALGLPTSHAAVNAASCSAKRGHDGGLPTPEPSAAAACDPSP